MKTDNILRDVVLCATILTCSVAVSAQGQQRLPTQHVREQVKNGQAPIVSLPPGNLRMRLAIMLQLHNQTELDDFIQMLYEPESLSYGQYLSVREFTDWFGPTQQEYETVVSFAEANGMVVTGRSANRMVVEVTASARDIERAFHLAIGIYQHPSENRLFYAPDREPSVDLDVPLWHIAGLDNFSIPQPASGPGVPGGGSGGSGSGPGGSFVGSDMRAAYYGGTSLTGSGQSLGLVEFSAYNLSDVQTYFYNVGQTLSVPISNVLLGGFNGVCGSCDDSEAALDIQQAISMAPGMSKVIVYEVNPSLIGNGGDVSIFNRMASDNIAKQLSCSWFWYPADPTTDDPIFKQFAAQGQSLLAASGDWGSIPNSKGWYFPAEDPNVTAVGGTDLTTTGPGGSWQSEKAWSSSGGGISPDNLPIPSYQQLSGVINSTNKGSMTERNVPDLSAQADYVNYICYSGSCSTNWGGTSFSAPRWAGFVALMNQQAAANGKASLGFLNPTIYPIGVGTTHGSYFHDIASGTNGSYSAVTGYDLVTGWGSPIGKGWLSDFSLTLAPSSETINPGSNAAYTVTVSALNGFAGTVALSVTGLPANTTGTFAPTSIAGGAGTSKLTIVTTSSTPLGTFTLTIKGTSGSLSHSAAVTLVVATPDFALSVTPASRTLNVGNNTTYTATVSSVAGFSGTVALTVTGMFGGATGKFNPSSIIGGSGSSTFTVATSPLTLPATYTLTIIGKSGSLTHSTTANVVVQYVTYLEVFANTGSMTTPRFFHTATLLPNGEALMAEGYNGTANVASAELYNPASGTFALTGSMKAVREAHTATLLNNGLVLIAGGTDNTTDPSAELYNSATGTFATTGNMNVPREQHTATLLPNGMVLIAGGEGSFGAGILASAELYNPATGTFSVTGSMNVSRVDHTATLLPNGTVLIAGGANSSYLASAEIYNPTTGTFALTGSMNAARYTQAATLLPNGLALIAGGFNNSGVLASAELYNSVTGAFALTGSMAAPREFPTATLLDNGLALIAGDSQVTELYNPATGTFSVTNALHPGRVLNSATLLQNGTVLVTGGQDIADGYPYLATSELYE
jgi:subtilase family serine protease